MELKPCPFCGGEPKFSTSSGDRQGPGSSTVHCTVCNAKSGYPTKQLMRCAAHSTDITKCQTLEDAIEKHDSEAVELWNNRTCDINKITCVICGTPVPQSEISQYAAYGGLPSPCCNICFECNDYSIKSTSELAGKSLLKRTEKL